MARLSPPPGGRNGAAGLAPSRPVVGSASASPWWPWAALALLSLPVLVDLATQVWRHEEQGHGPVILAVALWLIWQRRDTLAAGPAAPAPLSSALVLALGWLAWVLGQSQALLQASVLGPWLIGVGLLLRHAGWPGVRQLLLPLLALLLVVPMPGLVVQALTLPLKLGVSQAAESLLHLAGYPVGRSGVVLAVDQYRLLVADACAGLASMFTLEAMGLLYMQLRGPRQRWVDLSLALLLVPIALLANVVRVLVLVLVVFHAGDAAGQGFLHGFAGLLLFAVAMLLMLAADRALVAAAGWRQRRAGGSAGRASAPEPAGSGPATGAAATDPPAPLAPHRGGA